MNSITYLTPLLCLLCDLLSVIAYDECNIALLDNAKIYASTEISKDRDASKARLDGNGAWTAKSSDFSQYLFLDLKAKRNITAIATQGRPFSSEFVQEFRIEYGNKHNDYSEYKDGEGHTRLFIGNSDGETVKLNKFETPIIAQYLRINPTRWRDRISMRVELYGCDYVSESVYFDGRSFIAKQIYNPVSSESESLRFRFRTHHADGLILYSRGSLEDFIALQLVNNKLVLNIDLDGEGVFNSFSVGSLLDDNMWHDVYINRHHKNVTFTVDRVVQKFVLKGDFYKLNLGQEFLIGGASPFTFKKTGIVMYDNFTGCIENMFFNNSNFIAEMKEKKSAYHQYGDITYTCQVEQIESVTYKTSEAHVKIAGYKQSVMNCSLDFRTFNEDGMILYNKFSTEGFIKVYLEKGKIKLEFQGEKTPKVISEGPREYMSDGLWHKMMLTVKTNNIELLVDELPSKTTRLFTMLTGDEYLIGGGIHGIPGFIGCIRSLRVEGQSILVAALPASRRSDGLIVDACQMVDRCNPNPCENKGNCKQNWEEFKCDCDKTGYSGAVCHNPIHPLSCEAYKISHPKSRRENINIDIDGSGPLRNFPVTCEYPFEGPAETILHHKNERPTDVNGFSKPGSFIQNIKYDADMKQVVELVERAYSCKQHLRYECYKARLFNSPTPETSPFQPFSWWVSRSNVQMDYWAGGLPGTRKCNCGLFGTCRDPSKWCNCDSNSYSEWLSDEGDLTEKDYLPVRQLRFGDTGATLDEKKGRYYLGPLVCEGDKLFDNTVTFHYEDATIDLPTFDMGHSGDIYFQFKTTTENGVLINSRGPMDYIKVMLVEGDQIQFQYQAGNGPLGVSVETSYKLNDNNWHSVLVERNRKEARVVVDGSLSGEVRERAGPVRALYLTSKLVVGATVDYREGFVGCIRAFMVNGQTIDLQRLRDDYPYGIENGCVGKCQSSPCLNNGTCIDGYSSYMCDCQWTGFKGPICADEIGVNLRSDNYIRYNFENTISTLEEYIRVGFTTTDKTGMIVGISSHSEEYLNLMMSTSGHLRLVFDYGFERQEIIIRNENFALGQHHDLIIIRSDKGSRITIYVDNYEPIVYIFKIDDKADAQFNRLKSIYVGRNESMGTGEGFVGCISRVQFDDHLPLRRLFQESRRSNVWAQPDDIREDDCGIEPVTHPPEARATRPPPTLSPGVVLEAYRTGGDDSAILGGILALIFIALIVMAILISRYMSRHKGEYKTHEDTGAKDAPDADTAVRLGKTGHGVPRREEWFI